MGPRLQHAGGLVGGFKDRRAPPRRQTYRQVVAEGLLRVLVRQQKSLQFGFALGVLLLHLSLQRQLILHVDESAALGGLGRLNGHQAPARWWASRRPRDRRASPRRQPDRQAVADGLLRVLVKQPKSLRLGLSGQAWQTDGILSAWKLCSSGSLGLFTCFKLSIQTSPPLWEASVGEMGAGLHAAGLTVGGFKDKRAPPSPQPDRGFLVHALSESCRAGYGRWTVPLRLELLSYDRMGSSTCSKLSMQRSPPIWEASAGEMGAGLQDAGGPVGGGSNDRRALPSRQPDGLVVAHSLLQVLVTQQYDRFITAKSSSKTSRRISTLLK
ncbi:unnamed protein product [Protopolystoma xenopodis]|uniref:Uncharacterized protein n=1 Tax=Protopolystoma xenopodis TaxID=117903 RepID=A0A448XIM3_9PLAT|nr:unnamed protein product [Protopolystoma xenopodis]